VPYDACVSLVDWFIILYAINPQWNYSTFDHSLKKKKGKEKKRQRKMKEEKSC